jgi:hypothetical protein
MSGDLTPMSSLQQQDSRWDGTRWVTLDGRWWWDGAQWQPAPPIAALAALPPPPPPPPGWNPQTGLYPYHLRSSNGKGALVALSVGLFLIAFPALIIPPMAFLIWVLSVVVLIVALTW